MANMDLTDHYFTDEQLIPQATDTPAWAWRLVARLALLHVPTANLELTVNTLDSMDGGDRERMAMYIMNTELIKRTA